MSKDRPTFQDQDSSPDIRKADVLAAMETLRAATGHSDEKECATIGKTEERVSLFWRVFGGTILSIVALVVITVFNQITSGVNELRKEINGLVEGRGELAKKDELNSRVTTLWSSIKELQAANASLVAVSERAKLLEQQLDRQTRLAEDDRRELVRKAEDLQGKLHTLSERLATIEGRQGLKTSKTTPDQQ